jgi:hypothetical protein
MDHNLFSRCDSAFYCSRAVGSGLQSVRWRGDRESSGDGEKGDQKASERHPAFSILRRQFLFLRSSTAIWMLTVSIGGRRPLDALRLVEGFLVLTAPTRSADGSGAMEPLVALRTLAQRHVNPMS